MDLQGMKSDYGDTIIIVHGTQKSWLVFRDGTYFSGLVNDPAGR